jgi:hypothetical protein
MSSSTFRKCLEKRTYNNSTPHSMKIEELEEIYEDLEKISTVKSDPKLHESFPFLMGIYLS